MQKLSEMNGTSGTRHWNPSPVEALYTHAATCSGSVHPVARGSCPQNTTAGRPVSVPDDSHSSMNDPEDGPPPLLSRM
jgi:hypothetical protein